MQNKPATTWSLIDAIDMRGDRLSIPLRKASPTRFVITGDLFSRDIPFEFIDKVFAVMALCPQHTFQVLTKRPERMAAYFRDSCRYGSSGRPDRVCNVDELRSDYFNFEDLPDMPWPLPNVWLGTSVEDQKTADERIPHLLRCPAAVRWLSCEPLLGAVDLREWVRREDDSDPCPSCGGEAVPSDAIYKHEDACVYAGHDVMDGGGGRCTTCHQALPACHDCKHTPGRKYPELIHWVIAGGESGKGARPMHPDWARGLRDQCADAGVPFFFKQWGEFVPREDAACKIGKTAALAYTGGGIELPVDLTVGVATEYQALYRVGKKAAGRLLDGVEHNEYPRSIGGADAAGVGEGFGSGV